MQSFNTVNAFIFCAGYLQLAESKLKALSVAVRLKKPDKQFEHIKNYGVELQNNLCNLLKIRARLAEKQYALYKLHANYGRVYSEWSAIEKEMGDGLQVLVIILIILFSFFSIMNKLICFIIEIWPLHGLPGVIH